MKRKKSSPAARPFWADFFRGFYVALVFLAAAGMVLYGIAVAQQNTERICFGTQDAAEYGISAPDASSASAQTAS